MKFVTTISTSSFRILWKHVLCSSSETAKCTICSAQNQTFHLLLWDLMKNQLVYSHLIVYYLFSISVLTLLHFAIFQIKRKKSTSFSVLFIQNTCATCRLSPLILKASSVCVNYLKICYKHTSQKYVSI
jgi:hypothetical protein